MTKNIIDKLRKYYSLPDDISDEEVEGKCYNSFGHRVIELNMAVENFKNEIAKAFGNVKL